MKVKYADLVAEYSEGGWSTRFYLMEMGVRGFVGASTTCLLKGLGFQGAYNR